MIPKNRESSGMRFTYLRMVIVATFWLWNYVIILRGLPYYAARVSRFLPLSLGNTELAYAFVSLLSCLLSHTCDDTGADPTPSTLRALRWITPESLRWLRDSLSNRDLAGQGYPRI